MNLYVVYFSALPQKKEVKFHGGGEYTRNILSSVVEQNRENVNICILCPKWFELSEENEFIPFDCKKVEWVKVESPDKFMGYLPGDTIYYPMLGYASELREVTSIRKNNPSVKIYATIHDVRFLEYSYDWTEKYYESGIKRILFPLSSMLIDNWAKKIIKRPLLKKCLKALDRVYTVSNYSMQSILKQNKNIDISVYYQTVKAIEKNACDRMIPEEYILFVSGARPIKNLTHALLGFSKYKKERPDDKKKMVITGITEVQFRKLCDLPELNYEYIKSQCILLEYVSKEKLASLYKNCRFVLYVSKNEGFGLPVLEAASYGKTCVASNRASIPEVIGNGSVYVNPINDGMIADAIAFFDIDSNLKKYEHRVAELWPCLCERMYLDRNNLISDLLEN